MNKALDKLVEVHKELYLRNRAAFIEAHTGNNRAYQDYTREIMSINSKFYIALNLLGVPYESLKVEVPGGPLVF